MDVRSPSLSCGGRAANLNLLGGGGSCPAAWSSADPPVDVTFSASKSCCSKGEIKSLYWTSMPLKKITIMLSLLTFSFDYSYSFWRLSRCSYSYD